MLRVLLRQYHICNYRNLLKNGFANKSRNCAVLMWICFVAVIDQIMSRSKIHLLYTINILVFMLIVDHIYPNR